MRKDTTAVITTSDTDAAAFLFSEGLLFLRVDAPGKRAEFTFRESNRKNGNGLLFFFYRSRRLRNMFAARKVLRRAVDLARASPSKVCSAADLEEHEAAWANAQEGHREITTRAQ